MDLKSKTLVSCALIFIGLGLLLIFQSQNLGKLRLIACNVGQGDSQLIITPAGKQILVDGGPGSKVLDCLSAYMPFWDRTIEMIVLTHPQKDHMTGLLEVLAAYQVKLIMTTGVPNETAIFKAWQQALKSEKAKIYNPNVGDQIILEEQKGQKGQKGLSFLKGESLIKLEILWPPQEKIESWKSSPPSDLNETSIVTRLEYGQFCAYLTGDIPKDILELLIDKKCQVLKISHHGSKTGTNQQIVDKAAPQIVIIQVGKNSYGHPHKEITDQLKSRGVKILRNDINGIIELGSDGQMFKVKVEREG